MLNQYIQVPYIETLFGLATPALIISVVYLLVLWSAIFFVHRKGALRMEVVRFSDLMPGDKNKIILSLIGLFCFYFLLY